MVPTLQEHTICPSSSPASVSPSSAQMPCLQWPTGLLESTATIAPTPNSRPVYKQEIKERHARVFVSSGSVPVVPKRCDPRATATKTHHELWTLQVGDLCCCVANNVKAIPDTGGKAAKNNAWFPFIGPWDFCQVLNIYYDTIDGQMGPLLLEIRRFLRRFDLPEHVQRWTPRSRHSDYEELYETLCVEHDVPASNILGQADVCLGHTNFFCRGKRREIEDGVPKAVGRCRFLYVKNLERLQTLYCAASTPARMHMWMLSRGLMASKLIQANAGLQSGLAFTFDANLCQEDELDTIFGGIFKQKETHPGSDETNPWESRNGRSFFLSVQIDPKWFRFALPELVCAKRDRRGLRWTVHVGDLIAAQLHHDDEEMSNETFPFSVRWKACQILAIFKESHADADYSFQVRLFQMRRNINAANKSLLTAFETDQVSKVDLKDVLGPVALICGNSSLHINAIPGFLPTALCRYEGLQSSQDKQLQNLSREKMLSSLVIRGIELSHLYNEGQRIRLLTSLKELILDAKMSGACVQMQLECLLEEQDKKSSSVKSSPPSIVSSQSGRTEVSEVLAQISIDSQPYYVDHAAELEFLEEIVVAPSRYAYVQPRNGLLGGKPAWKVRVGDPVVVHFQATKAKAKKTQCYPMSVPWSIGEVITILRSSKSGDRASISSCERLKLEIRWFYRVSEIPGSSRANENTYAPGEEIVESDHCDLVSPSSLLAPAALTDGLGSWKRPLYCSNVPILEFTCKRFWSYHRKCMIPSGGLEGMSKRGQSHSKYNRTKLSACSHIEDLREDFSSFPAANELAMSPSEAFESVIAKMSLHEASREGYEDSSVLVGREKERHNIKQFLRNAISGTANDTKPTLFIGGAPGVGKTACVRAVVRDLQREQALGKIEPFEFVMLNGMEMREPLEAYVKLWEQVSGERGQCSAVVASKKLKALFSNTDVKSGVTKKIFVVLLDELDYLVTKKQEVIYDFFDWAIRSFDPSSHTHLIVVGVSNTLNLPDRLHPRVQSRLGRERCLFKSYNVEQIIAILEAKIHQASPSYKVFDDDAIKFAAKKTSALSGDIRKAFRICKDAAELALSRVERGLHTATSPIVQVKDTLQVSRESLNTAQTRSLSLGTPFEALLVVSLASLCKSTGRERGGFDVEEVITKMESIANATCESKYLPAPALDETLDILSRLSEGQIVKLETPRHTSVSYRSTLVGSGGVWPLVSLLVDHIAIFVALKNTDHKLIAEKYIMNSMG